MDGEPGYIKHHLNQILANVMDVTLDSADYYCAFYHFLLVHFYVGLQDIKTSI